MSKKPEEDLKQYRERVLDTKSTSFCGAKWYNATTWLGSGTTASCHHPPAHKIPIEEIKRNYTAIHNTDHKKEMRRMMQSGERPRECEYCWKMEDMGKDAVSDRTFKSIIYTDEELQQAFDADVKELLLKCETDRFLIDLELLLAVSAQKYQITPILVSLREDIDFTKFNSTVLLKEVFSFIRLIWKYRIIKS
jgi:hypothetical protein